MQQEARHRWAPSISRALPVTSTIVETLEAFPYPNLAAPYHNSNSNNTSSSFCLPFNIMSNGRDRTGEFQTTVKSFANKRVSTSVYYSKRSDSVWVDCRMASIVLCSLRPIAGKTLNQRWNNAVGSCSTRRRSATISRKPFSNWNNSR